jgi:hypothetical protein
MVPDWRAAERAGEAYGREQERARARGVLDSMGAVIDEAAVGMKAGLVLAEKRGCAEERAAVVAFVRDLPTLAQQIRDGEHRGKA